MRTCAVDRARSIRDAGRRIRVAHKDVAHYAEQQDDDHDDRSDAQPQVARDLVRAEDGRACVCRRAVGRRRIARREAHIDESTLGVRVPPPYMPLAFAISELYASV